MVKKKVSKNQGKSKRDGDALGVSGFTLGIVSFACMIFTPFLGVITSTVGFFMSLSQQKRHPTKFGRRGIILNMIGFILNIIVWILLVQYLIPRIRAGIPI